MTLDVQHLSFSFGEVALLRDVSFSVGCGEIVCLLGPNGSGKTTLLDCVMGFLRPTAGSVTVDGKDVRAYSRANLAKRMSFVPQLHHPTFPYSVREVVRMGAAAGSGLFGVPKPQEEQRVDRALERVGLLHLAGRPYTTLSGGELKLVLLARSLAQNAPLMILDEPTSSLDFRNEMIFLETLSSFVKQDGLSVLMATHALQHAFYFESRGIPVRAVLLSKGSPPRIGAPQTVMTAETLRDVYGVRAAVGDAKNDDGEPVKTVFLFGTDQRRGEG